MTININTLDPSLIVNIGIDVINIATIIFIFFKKRQIRNPKVNKTYSKLSIQMLNISLVLIAVSFLSQFANFNVYSQKGCLVLRDMLFPANTATQIYEWYTMNNILVEQRARCQEELMSKMTRASFEARFSKKEKRLRLKYIVTLVLILLYSFFSNWL